MITTNRPKITLSSRKSELTPKEVNELWTSVGWGAYPSQSVKAAIRNTTFLVAARDKDDNLIGLVRVMSDNHLSTWVADLAVHPTYQRKGVGTRLMKEVHGKFKETLIYFESAWEFRKCFRKAGFHTTDLTAYWGGK